MIYDFIKIMVSTKVTQFLLTLSTQYSRHNMALKPLGLINNGLIPQRHPSFLSSYGIHSDFLHCLRIHKQ